MPCGTGKTLVCLWVAEKLKVASVVVFLPSLALIQQTAIEWKKTAKYKLDISAICSDKTVALDEDGIIVDKDELWFPVLDNVNNIKKFLKNSVKTKEIKVVFCTYQSSPEFSKAAYEQKVEVFRRAAEVTDRINLEIETQLTRIACR